MALDSRQRAVSRRMLVALWIGVLTIGAALFFGDAMTLGDRLMRAAASSAIVAAWLAAAIGNVARLRFLSAEDIDAGGGEAASARVRAASAILQNTLEQAVLAIPVQVLAAVVLERSGVLIACLAGLFSIGRTLFWAGYARGAAARAFGFALTFYPSVLMLALSIGLLAARLI